VHKRREKKKEDRKIDIKTGRKKRIPEIIKKDEK
jgi:hypothetical protein